MACPHCGENLLHKQNDLLLCCGCGRPRFDLPTTSPLLTGLRRHGLVLVAGLLTFPLALGMAAVDALLSSVSHATAHGSSRHGEMTHAAVGGPPIEADYQRLAGLPSVFTGHPADHGQGESHP